jgi:hypothetical protein
MEEALEGPSGLEAVGCVLNKALDAELPPGVSLRDVSLREVLLKLRSRSRSCFRRILTLLADILETWYRSPLLMPESKG